MTKKEAEAALLALGGPSLEWTPNSEFRDDKDRILPGGIAIGNGGCYLALYFSLFFLRGYGANFVTHGMEQTILSYRLYKTLDDAKAACERHHATGKWGKWR